MTAEDARYLEGYAQHPEPEDGSVAVAVMGTWDDWSDASKPKASSASVRARARKGVR